MGVLYYIRLFLLKILLFLEKQFIKIKSPSANAKGLGMVWLPLLGRFRTFYWGEIIEELPNIYKLKELINVPISAINNA